MSSGFLFIDKPVGPTSHDIIAQLRGITGIKKIGHAGTLDPFASGLLIVGVGRESTKRLDEFLKQDKGYIATLKLGASSDTYDRMGKISSFVPTKIGTTADKQVTSNKVQTITEQKVEEVLEKFRGEIEQIPPMFSAKKIKGKKLYELARKGEVIERQPSQVSIKELQIVDYSWPLLKINCQASSGTYIRSLAHDIGQELGVGAYLDNLERISIGRFDLDEAIELKELNQHNWQDYLKQITNG